MKPIRLYEYNATNFDSNGLGSINSAYNSVVREVDNGLFELSFKCNIKDILFEFIEEDMLVKADASEILLDQMFRIYYISKEIKGIVEVKAQHLSYDLLDNLIMNVDLKNVSCEYALNHIFRNATELNNFTGHSNIVNSQNYVMELSNCYEAIKGKQGSIVDTFGLGAKLLRDNYKFSVLTQRGESKNVLITYRKNLKGITAIYDSSEVVTKIYPYAYIDQEGMAEKVKITLPEKYITSDRVGRFKREKLLYIDYTDESITDVATLRSKASSYFETTNNDKPKASYKIDVLTLSKNSKYKNLETLNVDDEVIVRDLRLGINATARVASLNYDPINSRVLSIEVGDIINHFKKDDTSRFDKIDKNINDLANKVDNIDVDVTDQKFPDTLPAIPVLSYRSGLGTIVVSWTFENKSYYNYELYASQIKGFTPGEGNKIFSGKASVFLHEVKPNQTWFYKVRAGNTHGNYTTYSAELEAVTAKIAEGTEWFDKAAINDAIIGQLSLDRGWVGQLEATYLKVKGYFEVRDGNNNRTLYIDSYGRVYLNVSELNILAGANTNVPTKSEVAGAVGTANSYTDAQIKVVDGQIKDKVSQTDYDANNDKVNDKFAEVSHSIDGWNYKFEQAGTPQIITNGDIKPSNLSGWYTSNNAQFWLAKHDCIGIYMPNITDNEGYAWTQWEDVESGFDYSFQCSIMPEFNTKGCDIYVFGQDANGNTIQTEHIFSSTLDQWHDVRHSFKILPNVVQTRVRIDVNGRTSHSGFIVWFKKVFMCKGKEYHPPFSLKSNEVVNASTSITRDGIMVQDGKIIIVGRDGVTKVFWVDETGQLTTDNIYIYGAEKPANLEIGGTGNKGIGIRSHDNSIRYLDFCTAPKEATYEENYGTGQLCRLYGIHDEFFIMPTRKLTVKRVKPDNEILQEIDFKTDNFIVSGNITCQNLMSKDVVRAASLAHRDGDNYTMLCHSHLNMQGRMLLNPNIQNTYESSAFSINEEYVTKNKEDGYVDVDVVKLNEALYKENKKLKQQQFEQDEMIIENAFEIANIQLGGLYV